MELHVTLDLLWEQPVTIVLTHDTDIEAQYLPTKLNATARRLLEYLAKNAKRAHPKRDAISVLRQGSTLQGVQNSAWRLFIDRLKDLRMTQCYTVDSGALPPPHTHYFDA